MPRNPAWSTFGTGYSGAAPTEAQVAVRNDQSSGGPPICWLHSAGAGAVGVASAEPIKDPSTQATFGSLAYFGPILSADTGGTLWGNDTSQSRLTDMIAYLRSSLGAHATKKAILLGVSMGGMLALNWARANPTLVAAICLFYPATSLQAIHDGTGGAANGATTTEAAYGGSLAAFNAAVAAHDPSQHATDYQSIPIKMWYSTADTTVGSANQTAFAAAVGGSNFTSRSLGAVGHADMTQIPAGEVASFLSPYV